MLWNTIFQIGKTKALKLSYIILFLVPLFAKLFSQINETLIININSLDYTFVLSLPFNWYVLYYSMCFISIANIIYAICCPSFIKDYNSYEDFKISGRDQNYLFKKASDFISKKFNSQEEFIKLVSQKKFDYEIETPQLEKFYDEYKRIITPHVFWITYDLGNQKYKFWRIVCFVFYVLGFLLLFILVIEKFIYVTKSFVDSGSFFEVLYTFF